MKKKSIITALLVLAFSSLFLSSCGSGGSVSTGTAASAQGQTARLKLSNKLYRPIAVRLERLGQTGYRDVTVPARSSESISVQAGTYKYSAVADGFSPTTKYKEIEASRSYTLYF
jgi:hypothetical protein